MGGRRGKSTSPPEAENLDQYGWGDYDPATGLYEGYNFPPAVQARLEGRQGPTWHDLLTHWTDVEADFHEHYSIDLSSGVLAVRDARWLRARLAGLLSTDSRLARRFEFVAPLNIRHLTLGGRL